jgi:AmiR/NasT family two-component response regulator
MFQHSLKQTLPLAQRLVEEAKRLRKEASDTAPGIKRQRLIQRARETETAYQINAWITTPGLRAPT